MRLHCAYPRWQTISSQRRSHPNSSQGTEVDLECQKAQELTVRVNALVVSSKFQVSPATFCSRNKHAGKGCNINPLIFTSSLICFIMLKTEGAGWKQSEWLRQTGWDFPSLRIRPTRLVLFEVQQPQGWVLPLSFSSFFKFSNVRIWIWIFEFLLVLKINFN